MCVIPQFHFSITQNGIVSKEGKQCYQLNWFENAGKLHLKIHCQNILKSRLKLISFEVQ